MGKIKRLDTQTINKIAAGEVVENPASVVKELVENAIDAGATEITIEYLAGGLKMLSVADNGCGMSEEDALLAFEQHATSKISAIEDLLDIATQGFRGEALASIASVSKVKLTTSEGEQGVEVTLSGGTLQGIAPAAQERGTTIDIRDLFFNVPARKKFQKSPTSSATDLIKTVIKLMLAHRGIHFQLVSQGKTQLEGKASDNKDRIDEILGSQFMKDGYPIEYENMGVRIEGFIGSPGSSRLNRAGQYLFVNGRPVQAYALSLAVKDGYGTRIEEKKHPIFVLFITLPGNLVDVNVHPQKKEVRFKEEAVIKDHVRKSVAKSFFSKKSEYKVPLVQFEEPVFTFEEPTIEWTVKPNEVTFFQEEDPLHVVGKYKHFLLLAPPFISFNEGLVLVNLKRARKRVFFEAAKDEKPVLQQLMTPEIFSEEVSEEESKALLSIGISARPFGLKEVVIDAVAPDLRPVKEVFVSALDLLRKGASQTSKRADSLKLLALKHLHENWDQKTQAEASALIRKLLKTKEPLICPEGKPICKGYSLSELER